MVTFPLFFLYKDHILSLKADYIQLIHLKTFLTTFRNPSRFSLYKIDLHIFHNFKSTAKNSFRCLLPNNRILNSHISVSFSLPTFYSGFLKSFFQSVYPQILFLPFIPYLPFSFEQKAKQL